MLTEQEEGKVRTIIGAFDNGKSVTELNAATTLGDNDVMEVLQGGENKKVPVSVVKESVNSDVLTEVNKRGVFNATVSVPLSAGTYYTLSTAIASVPTASKSLGLDLKFSTGANTWVVYRYNGADLAGWATTTNWEQVPDAAKLTSLETDLKAIKKIEYSLFGSVKNDGTVFDTTLLKMTDFIPVAKDTIINAYDGSTSFYNYRACCFYDVNKVPISSLQFATAGMQNIILSDANIPLTAYYFRSSTLVSKLSESYIYYKANNGLLNLDNIYRTLLNLEVQKLNLDVQILETDVALLDYNKAKNSDIYEDSYNICPQAYEVGKLILPNSPTIANNARYVLFDYIEVEESKTYYFSCIKGGTRAAYQVYFTMWDTNKNIITAAIATANKITIPVGCKFVRISLDTNNLTISDFMLNERIEWMYDDGYSTPATYPFMEYLYNNVIDPSKNNILTSRTQKKYVAFGDSITQFGNYPQLCGKYIGANITYNFGVGGTHYAMWNNSPDGLSYDAFSMYRLVDAIVSGDWSIQIAGATVIDGINGNTKHTDLVNVMKNIDYTTMDIMSLAFGTNDYGGNNILGNLSDNNKGLTTMGSVNYILEKLSFNFPKMQIFILLPIFRTWNNGTETSDTRLNANGLTLVQYHDGIKSCCEKNHIPFVDLYNEGINVQNHTTYLSDGCHPTKYGYEWLGRKLAGYLLGK